MAAYERGLFGMPAAAPWQPATLLQALEDIAQHRPHAPLHVTDLACGAGVFLLELAFAFHRESYPGVFTGIDRGINDAIHPPLNFLPDNEERLQAVLDRFSPEPVRAADLPFPVPTYRRADLDDTDWGLDPASQDLIVSMTAIPYIADKLAFLSRVFQLLRPGGMAVLHFDEMRPPFYPAGLLRRVYLPDDVPFVTLLQTWRQSGIDVTMTTARDRRHVLYLRRQSDETLACDLILARSEKETWENVVGDKAWGCRSHYARPGEAAPETAADRITQQAVDDQAQKAAIAIWAAHRAGGDPAP
jgi:SAM-dependent methyltransferase